MPAKVKLVRFLPPEKRLGALVQIGEELAALDPAGHEPGLCARLRYLRVTLRLCDRIEAEAERIKA